MKESDLLGAEQSLWIGASNHDHVNALGWLVDNGYKLCAHNVAPFGVAGSRPLALSWVQQRGIGWGEGACVCAATFNNLPMLKWLCQSGCPWGS